MTAKILVSKAEVQDLQRRLGLSADGVIGAGTWAAILRLLPAVRPSSGVDVTVARLVAAGLHPTQARNWHPYLSQFMPQFEINTPARVGGFIGQIMIESGGFTMLEENLNYTDAKRLDQLFSAITPANAKHYVRNPKGLANLVYANRLGNGDVASGDGWRFRGRGLKQLTGRANYAAAAKALGRDYVANPDMLLDPHDATLTACWFWQANGCNAVADTGDSDRLTRIVNGPGMVAKDKRRLATAKARRAFQ